MLGFEFVSDHHPPVFSLAGFMECRITGPHKAGHDLMGDRHAIARIFPYYKQFLGSGWI